MSPIVLDEVQLLRVAHDTVDGTPNHFDGVHRCGPVRLGGGWWWQGDVRTPAEVEQWVSLSELEEAQ